MRRVTYPPVSPRPWRYVESNGGHWYIYAHGQTQPLFHYKLRRLNAAAKRQLVSDFRHIVKCVNECEFTHNDR